MVSLPAKGPEGKGGAGCLQYALSSLEFVDITSYLSEEGVLAVSTLPYVFPVKGTQESQFPIR